jgi:type II secretory pathway component PulM
MFAAALDKLDSRQQRLLVAGSGALLIVALFSYVLLPQIRAYRKEVAIVRVLEQAGSSAGEVTAELERLTTEVAALEKRLYGDMGNLPDNQLESFVVGRLQAISWLNNVELLGVEPRAGETLQSFEESLFQVELSGNYADLFNWLEALKKELGFIVIKEYEMRPVENVASNPELAARLTVASYRVVH